MYRARLCSVLFAICRVSPATARVPPWPPWEATAEVLENC